MSKRIASVVIGANYGDEGKGLITDFETERLTADVVCRFNGGAQAGHTVSRDDKLHVFGHVAAGTFAGAKTLLGSKFIVNPMVLEKELRALKHATVMAHPRARVSTIYDMALNAMVETKRGNDRHGSCGLGINETVTRHEQFPITVEDLRGPIIDLASKLKTIRQKYIPSRMQELGVEPLTNAHRDIFESDGWHNMAVRLADRAFDLQRPRQGSQYVFEGAQGLALDEFLGEFPHVTRSITGLPYAIIEAAEAGVQELQPIYVTRSYLTRHGAGPLPAEGQEFGAYNAIDTTNIHNQWQGTLRYAPLNLPMLDKLIAADMQRAEFVAMAHGVKILRPTIAVTCLDQLHGDVTIIDMDYNKKTLRTSQLPRYIGGRLNLHVSHISRGPMARDVEYTP
jgi:adenylosuccinate synthase